MSLAAYWRGPIEVACWVLLLQQILHNGLLVSIVWKAYSIFTTHPCLIYAVANHLKTCTYCAVRFCGPSKYSANLLALRHVQYSWWFVTGLNESIKQDPEYDCASICCLGDSHTPGTLTNSNLLEQPSHRDCDDNYQAVIITEFCICCFQKASCGPARFQNHYHLPCWINRYDVNSLAQNVPVANRHDCFRNFQETFCAGSARFCTGYSGPESGSPYPCAAFRTIMANSLKGKPDSWDASQPITWLGQGQVAFAKSLVSTSQSAFIVIISS